MSAWLLRNRFTLETQLSPAETLDRLRKRVWTPVDEEAEANEEPGPDEALPTEYPLFMGIVTARGFRLERLAPTGSIFAPAVRGQVDPSAAGSTVTIDVRVNPGGCVFLTLWLALLTGLPLFSVLQMDQDRRSLFWLLPVFVPLLMGTPVYLIGVGDVWYETRKIRAILGDLLAPSPPGRAD